MVNVHVRDNVFSVRAYCFQAQTYTPLTGFSGFLVLFILLSIVWSDQSRAQDRVGIPDNGVELGLGWDTDKSQVIHNRCILFAPVQEAGQTIAMELHDVSDTSEVMEALNVSASMSVKTLAGKGSAQAAFASSSKVSASSQSLLIRATVDNGVMFVAPSHPMEIARYAHVQPGQEFREEGQNSAADRRDELSHSIVLTEEAQDILGDGSAQEVREFERYCGDSFVSAIYSGAEIVAIASSMETDTSSKTSFSSKMRGEMSAWGAKIKAEASAAGKQAKRDIKTQADIQFTQIGGRGGIIPTNAQEFMNKVADLPLEAEQGPRFHSMEVTAYHELPFWPAQVPAISKADDTLDVLSNYYWTMQSIEQQIETSLAEKKCTKPSGSGSSETCTKWEAVVDATVADKLRSFQDDILELRRQLLPVLQESLELNGESASRSCCWGLWEVTDKELAARIRKHQKTAQELLKDLRRRSMEKLNPNLLRLHLALPDSTRDMASGAASTAVSLVETYVKRPSIRACQREPNSPECINNRQLTALQSCVPSSPGDWEITDTCQRALTQAETKN